MKKIRVYNYYRAPSPIVKLGSPILLQHNNIPTLCKACVNNTWLVV